MISEQQKESDWGKGKARAYWLAMALFALFFTALLLVMAPDFRGRPIYPTLSVVLDASTDELSGFFEGEPFVFEFDARQADYNEIYWLNLLPTQRQEIEVVVENLTTGERVAEEVTIAGQNTHFEPGNEIGDRMRISMRWLIPPPPRLVLAPSSPSTPVTVSMTGREESEAAPLFYFGHKPDPKADWDRSLLLYSAEDFDQAGAASPDVPEGFEVLDFVDREAVTIRFTANDDNLNFLKIPGLVEHPSTRVKIIIRNETSGEIIKESMAENGVDYERRFVADGTNSKGDRIAIELIWRLPPQPNLQRVQFAAEPPILTMVGDRVIEDFPLAFQLRSPWPTLSLHWLWLPALAAFIYAWFSMRRAFGYLVLLGLACAATSMLTWQQNYSHHYPHIDPDGYGLYGERIAHFITGEGDRATLRDEMHEYSHSHVALTPVLVAIGVLCGLPTTIAYLVVVNLASFGNLLLLWRLATRNLGMEMRAAMMLVTFYATHFFVLKSFGRTSTDSVGELLAVVMLYMLADRLTRVTTRQTVLISLFVLLQILARPPGIVIGPFMLGMTLLCDVYRERKLDLGKRVMTGLKIGIGPLLIIVLCYLAFDWLHNQELAFAKSKQFQQYSTAKLFWFCMPGLLQFFPLFWIGLLWREWREHLPKMAVFAIWGAFFTVLLIAVKAPFLLRLFLPVVPAVVLLAAAGMAWLEAKNRLAALVITLLLCAVNVGIQVYNSTIEYVPPVMLIDGKQFDLPRFIY